MNETKRGRPRKDATPAPDPARPLIYGSARDYLAAVVAGTERPHAARIAAARALLAYEAPRLQGPVVSASNVALARRAERSHAAVVGKEWKAKEAAIRAKHSRNGSP